MALWLCLRFEQLPLNSLSHASDNPVVVLSKQRVIAANEAASALGIQRGQSSTTVQALLHDSNARLLERDLQAEARALGQLEAWAYSITPSLERWRDNCLLLEIGGCLTLFGGLTPLLNYVATDLSRRDHQLDCGIAETRLAAWLLSYTDHGCDLGESLPARIAALPTSLIDEFPKAVSSLSKAGIHDFQGLLALPMAAIGRRCGRDFCHWLQRLTGVQQEAQRDYIPPQLFNDALWFGFEIRHQQELHPAITDLLQRFCLFLHNTQLDTQHVEWRLLRFRGTAQSIIVRSSEAHNQWKTWFELTCLQLDQVQITHDIEGIELIAEQLTACIYLATDLFSSDHNREPLNALLDRLRSRLGLNAVKHVGIRDEYLPEYRLQSSSQLIDTNTLTSTQTSKPEAQRPFWLLPEPQAIHKQQGILNWNGNLELIYGPERIEDNWWATPVSRDYFIAQRQDRQTLWIFQDRRSRRWYLHGIFA
tara:strand:+ start:208 stop:1641 length:1434 start_codon:yes stop_codon:yes gene_type:complete